MDLRIEIFPADLDRCIDFYTSVLRFTLVVRRDGYAAFERDGVRIGAALHPSMAQPALRLPPTGVELVLEVDDLGGEHSAIVHAGWPITEPPQDRPWGLRDFRIRDPDGYYLRITQR